MNRLSLTVVVLVATLLHETKSVSKAEWVAAQPKPIPQPKSVASFPALGADGRPLNLDFESGSLKNWTATGKAFEKQPVQGDLRPEFANELKPKE